MTDKSLKDCQTKQDGWCNRPDRHNSKLQCGHPLPCPHHTAVIDPPEVTFIPPATADKIVKRLDEIAKATYEIMGVPEHLLKMPMGINTVCPKCKQRPCIC